MKIDFENLLPAEVIDRTRTTEKLVLGAILCHHSPKDDQLSIAIQAGIGPEDFCTPQHRTIYQSMLDTWGEAGTDFLDQVLQAAHYRLKEKPEYLYGMMDEGGSIQGQSLAWHARTLKSLSFDRQELTLVAEYGGLLQQGQDARDVFNDLLAVRSEKKNFQRGEPEAFGNGLDWWWSKFDRQRNDNFSDDLEIKSHLPSLDELTQGLRRSEVAVLAGAPGSGKSALAMNLLLAAINGSRVKTALISLEMTIEDILARIINQMVDDVPLLYLLNPSRLQPRNWKNRPSEYERLLKEIEKARHYTDQLREEGVFQAEGLNSFSAESVLGAVDRAARAGADFVVVDHLHRVMFTERSNFAESMTRLMVNLTEIAKATNTCILALSQINRDACREGRRPRLTDLKGSGGIEENASLALILHRNLESTEGDLYIAKARSGRAGSIPLVFNANRLTFREVYDR